MKMFDRNIVVYYKIQRKRKKIENSNTTDITNNQVEEEGEIDKIVEGDIIIDIPNSFDYNKKEIKTKIIEEIEKNIKNVCCKIEGYFDTQKYIFEYNYIF